MAKKFKTKCNAAKKREKEKPAHKTPKRKIRREKNEIE